MLAAALAFIVVPCSCVDDGNPSDADIGDNDANVCAEDSDCDDLLFCNGVERCSPDEDMADEQGCVSGAPPCTSGQTCSEEEDRCETDCNQNSDADDDGSDAVNCGGRDCDDGDPTRYPGNAEVCDGDDEDCDHTTIGPDLDEDGHVSMECCNAQPDGSMLCGRDCDDSFEGVNPDAPEVCDEFPDNNCDGANPFDVDGDGYDEASCGGNDCDDEDPEIHPDREEACGNEVDEDCDGAANDLDCDGHDAITNGGDDCNDEDADIHPGAEERCNAWDDDCDGIVPEVEDRDHDGAHACDEGPGGNRDCDDSNADRFPGNPEVCDDGTDQDCDGDIDDQPCWVLVTEGAFNMGSPSDEVGRDDDDDEDRHEVTLTRDFFILSTEVTQRHFEEVMGYNPSYFVACPDCPVESVNWHEAEAFCNALSDAAGLDRCYECFEGEESVICEPSLSFATPYDCAGYRLPTEAEWEYAARAGSEEATFNGNLDDIGCSSDVLDPIAWYCGNSDLGSEARSTQPVGTRRANDWGLFDMLGNVYEWVYEFYGAYPPGPATDPTGPETSPYRNSRGGNWESSSDDVRAADRNGINRETLEFNQGTGFRAVRTRL